MQECNLDCYGKCKQNIYFNKKCILHCEKGDYQSDKTTNTLEEFYNKFILYVIDEAFNDILHSDGFKVLLFTKAINKEKYIEEENSLKTSLNEYLQKGQFDNIKYNEAFKKILFTPSCIHFPKRDSRDTFDYLKILNLFGQIHFNYCEFYISYLELQNIECFFQDCHFHDTWTLYNYNILENEDNVIYQTCTFNKSISNYTPEKSSELAIYKHSQFDYSCKFKSSIEFNRVEFNDMLFNTNQYNYIENNKIKQLKFEKCTFEKKFKLNNYIINDYICIDSLFKNKFEFKENKINTFIIYNSNFNYISDLYGCSFKKFNIEKSIFDDFTGFENCTFGTNNKLKKEIAIFKYATFKDTLTLRSTKFLSGLDIKNINLQGESNFLDSEIELKNTNRETFRTLKHSFDHIGNIIDANKYYQKEMQKREEELEDIFPNKYFELIIFKIHGYASAHSQNALLSLFWIFIISYIYSYTFNFLDTEYMKDTNLNTIFINSVIYYIYSTKDLFHLFMLSTLMSLPYIVANSFIKNNFYFLIVITSTFFYIYLTRDFTLSIVSNNINPFSIITEKGKLNFHELLYRIIIAYLLYQFIISIRQNTRQK